MTTLGVLNIRLRTAALLHSRMNEREDHSIYYYVFSTLIWKSFLLPQQRATNTGLPFLNKKYLEMFQIYQTKNGSKALVQCLNKNSHGLNKPNIFQGFKANSFYSPCFCYYTSAAAQQAILRNYRTQFSMNKKDRKTTISFLSLVLLHSLAVYQVGNLNR